MTKSNLQLIKKALLTVELEETKIFDSIPLTDVTHTQEYINTIDNFLTSTCQHSVFNLKKRIIAALIAAAVLIFATACAFREPIAEFFIDIYEKYTSFSTNNEKNRKIDEVYSPLYIPHGYDLTSRTISTTDVNTYWSDGTHQIILFQSPNGIQNTIMDTENEDYQQVEVNSLTVYYIFKHNTYICLWENDKYVFSLSCSGSLEIDVIKEIISSFDIYNEA